MTPYKVGKLIRTYTCAIFCPSLQKRCNFQMVAAIVFSQAPILASAFVRCLSEVPSVGSVKTCSSLDELIQAVTTVPVDLILMDFEPRHYVVLGEIQRISPTTAVVLWTRDLSMELAYQAIHAGVRGILPQNTETHEIKLAIGRVLDGEICVDGRTSQKLLTLRPVRLTPRESQMMALLASGHKNKEIAGALSIAEGSVKIYLSRLYQKVGAKDRYELALYGLKHMGLDSRAGGTTTANSADTHNHVIFRSMTA